MDIDLLWIAMIANVINNLPKIIKTLGISQEKFLRCSSYAAKSSLGKRGKNHDDFTLDHINFIFENELQRRKKELLKEKHINKEQGIQDSSVFNSGTDFQQYEDLLDWAKQQEKFAESLIMTIDAFLFFNYRKYPSSVIDSIIFLALYNEVLVTADPIYLSRRNSHFYEVLSNGEKTFSEGDKPIEKLEAQYWYQVKYSEKRGLSYQMQYFKYCKEFNKEDRIAFENIKERRENALIAITGFGYIYLKDYLYSILKVLRDKKWGIIPWKTKFKGDLKFFLSAEGIYELCFNASNFNFEECCEPVIFESDNQCSGWKTNPPAEREIDDIKQWMENLKKELPNAFLILFVSNMNEMKRIEKYMDSELYNETVFAYLSETDDDENMYISFTKGNFSYKYALKIEKDFMNKT